MDTALLESLSRVIDPEIRQPITDLGMVAEAKTEGSTAVIRILLTIVGCPAAVSIERDVREAALATPGIRDVDLTMGVMSPEQRAEFITRVRGKRESRAPQFGPDSLTRVIAVTSGKGGVGKSSVTAHLARALSDQGLSVGVIDADIFGFSIPGLLGMSQNGVTPSPTRIQDMIVAPEADGIRAISIGMFLREADARDTAVSWRGPMLHRTLEQFLRDVWFGDLDVLLLDLPPGTGDIALSVGQLLPHAEILVTTTPQVTAADVAVRSGLLAMQTGQRILGVVENMSGIVAPDGSTLDVFGSGGGTAVAERLTAHVAQTVEEPYLVEVLASLPLSVPFREACDAGAPAPADDIVRLAIEALAKRIVDRPVSLARKRLPIHTG